MFKKFVAVLIAAISVFSLSGCGSQTDIDAINEKLESMESRMEDLETSLDRMAERNAEEKEDVREVASNAEETPSNTSNPDAAAPDGSNASDPDADTPDGSNASDPDAAAPDASNETDSTDVGTDLDKVYDAVQAWVDDHGARLEPVYYYKCALINDDDIPEVLLFDDYSGLFAIILVDEDYEVRVIDTLKRLDGLEYEAYDPKDVAHTKVSLSAICSLNHAGNALDESETFCYNPKANSFAMAYSENDISSEFASHAYMELSLSDKMIIEIGRSAETNVEKDISGMYRVENNKIVSSSAYDEYNAQFTYTDSFVVKEESYFLPKSAFDAFKSEIGAQ